MQFLNKANCGPLRNPFPFTQMEPKKEGEIENEDINYIKELIKSCAKKYDIDSPLSQPYGSLFCEHLSYIFMTGDWIVNTLDGTFKRISVFFIYEIIDKSRGALASFLRRFLF